MSGEAAADKSPRLILSWNDPVPDGYEVAAVDESTHLMIVCPVANPQLEVK